MYTYIYIYTCNLFIYIYILTEKHIMHVVVKIVYYDVRVDYLYDISCNGQFYPFYLARVGKAH